MRCASAVEQQTFPQTNKMLKTSGAVLTQGRTVAKDRSTGIPNI